MKSKILRHYLKKEPKKVECTCQMILSCSCILLRWTGIFCLKEVRKSFSVYFSLFSFAFGGLFLSFSGGESSIFWFLFILQPIPSTLVYSFRFDLFYFTLKSRLQRRYKIKATAANWKKTIIENFLRFVYAKNNKISITRWRVQKKYAKKLKINI